MQPHRHAATTDGTVAATAVAWRWQHRPALTVIVKVECALVHGGEAQPTGRAEIALDDVVHGPQARSARVASDLVPLKKRCDVTFVGHAYTPEGRPMPSASVRIGLARDAAILDKSLYVFGDRTSPTSPPQPFARMPLTYERAVGGVGRPNPVGSDRPNLVDPRDPSRAACFAPLGHAWPSRAALAAVLDAAVPELSDATPWEAMQAAPVDQQIDAPRGGEWLVLDGLHPTLPRVQTRLPAFTWIASVTAPFEANVPLVCDTLAIDGDRQVVSIVLRGHVEVIGGDAALPAIRVIAGLRGFSPPRPSTAPEPRRDAPRVPFSTMALGASDQVTAAAKPLSPFPISQPSSDPPHAPMSTAPWRDPLPKPPNPADHPLMGTLPIEGLRSPFATVKKQSVVEPPPPSFAPASLPAAPPQTYERERDAGAAALEAKLKAAGAGADDLAALLGALKPLPKRQDGK